MRKNWKPKKLDDLVNLTDNEMGEANHKTKKSR